MLHRQQRSKSGHLATGDPSSLSATSGFLFALMGIPHIIPPAGTHEVDSATKTSLLSRAPACVVGCPLTCFGLAAWYPFVVETVTFGRVEDIAMEAGEPPCIEDITSLESR